MRWNRGWALRRLEEGRVLLSAGADESYELDGLAPSTVAALLAWSAGGEPLSGEARSREPLSGEALSGEPLSGEALSGEPLSGEALSREAGVLDAELHGVADHLVSLGALVVTSGASEALIVLGDGPVAVEIRSSALVSSTDLTVIVAEGPGAVHHAETSPPRGPHLLVDATGHHTVVLGPYVIPGYTACLECLALRSIRRWSPPVVAASPQVAGAPAVIAQLTAIQVAEIERGASKLLNATTAWDLSAGTCQRNDLLKVPNCSRCRSVDPQPTINLPWVQPAAAPAQPPTSSSVASRAEP